jgi:hypothetical protein
MTDVTDILITRRHRRDRHPESDPSQTVTGMLTTPRHKCHRHNEKAITDCDRH